MGREGVIAKRGWGRGRVGQYTQRKSRLKIDNENSQEIPLATQLAPIRFELKMYRFIRAFAKLKWEGCESTIEICTLCVCHSDKSCGVDVVACEQYEQWIPREGEGLRSVGVTPVCLCLCVVLVIVMGDSGAPTSRRDVSSVPASFPT